LVGCHSKIIPEKFGQNPVEGFRGDVSVKVLINNQLYEQQTKTIDKYNWNVDCIE